MSPSPSDGSLPEAALAELGERPFGLYVHVPFCTVRCGYCDFNTYTAEELGPAGGAPGASRATYAQAAVAEVRRARRVLGERDLPVSTIFFGGGTPTLLSPDDLGSVVAAAARGVRAGARRRGRPPSRTPTRVDAASLERLREVGINRVSFGMQSQVPHVLDGPRPHPRPATGARGGRVGTRRRLRAGQPRPDLRHAGGVAGRLDHLGRRRGGVRARPRVGVLADRRGRHRAGPTGAPRRAADARRGRPRRQVRAGRRAARGRRAGLVRGLELVDRRRDTRCRHNLLYWTGGDWWGVGPGAHSHVGGVRWWNVKHPAAYADRIGADRSPAPGPRGAGRRGPPRRAGAARAAAARGARRRRARRGRPGRRARPGRRGLLVERAGRVALTERARLLADGVVRELVS